MMERILFQRSVKQKCIMTVKKGELN
jgi:hypothetical protein